VTHRRSWQLSAFVVFWIDLLKPIHQCDIFAEHQGTQAESPALTPTAEMNVNRRSRSIVPGLCNGVNRYGPFVTLPNMAGSLDKFFENIRLV